jgi:hypothetical protein
MRAASERCCLLSSRAIPRGCVIVAPEAVKIEAVSKVSTLQKLGAAARVAGQQAGRSRTLSALMTGARTIMRSFTRAAHQLWLEVIGVIFLIMALSFVGATVKEYGKYHAGGVGPSRFAVAIACAVTFGWFSLSSFWRARRKSQRP